MLNKFKYILIGEIILKPRLNFWLSHHLFHFLRKFFSVSVFDIVMLFSPSFFFSFPLRLYDSPNPIPNVFFFQIFISSYSSLQCG